MYASLFSHNETVLYLLEMKADVNAKNPNGKTPLMLASVCGSNETIQLLLQVLPILFSWLHLNVHQNVVAFCSLCLFNVSDTNGSVELYRTV